MFSGKGDNGSRRGNSLLRFAGEEDPRARAGGTYVSLGTPEAALSAADIHRRARSRRERVENAYLAELASLPEPPQPEPPQPEPPQPAPLHAVRAQARPSAPGVLDQFAKIDAALAARGRASPAAREEPLEDAPQGRAYAGQDSPSGRAEPEAWRPLIDPQHILSAVQSWKAPIIGLTLLGALLGGLTALSTPKLFYASAELSIDPRGLKVIDNGVSPDGFVSDTFAIVDSQVRLMTSPDVLEAVVKQLSLQDDTEFNGELKSSWLEALLGIIFRKDAGSDKSLAAVEYLADHVFVERGAKTYVINVASASVSPVKAADIANKLVAVYMDKQREQQSATVQQTTNELTSRLAALKQSVEEAEQAVEAYKSENDLAGVEGRLIDDEAILRANDQLAAAKGLTINLNARAKSIKTLTPESFVDGGMADEINSPVLTGLRSQYSAAKQKRDGMATKLGPRHPERIQAESELDSLSAGIAAEIRRVSASMQADLRRAIQTEQDLAAHLAELKVQQGRSGADLVKLRELQREAAAKGQVYEAFLLRAKQTSEQIDLNTADIKVIAARPPKTPAGTSRKLIVLTGLMGGFGLGLALAILKGIIASLSSQMGKDAPRHVPASRPEPNGGGGMFRQRHDGAPRPAAAEPAPPRMTPAHVQRLAEAFAPASAPALERQPEPEPPALERFLVYPQPAPEPQPQSAPPAPQPVQHWQPQPPQPMQNWQPQPQPPLQGYVPPGPMMYPQQAFAPQPFQQQVFAPQPAFAPQPMPAWPQPAPWFAVQQPVHLQMPAPPQPVFHAPPAPAAIAEAPPAPHPFAQEAAPAPASAAATPAPRAPAGDRLSQIQESIDEFRSALTSFAKQRRVS